MDWFLYLRATFERELRPRAWGFVENLTDPGFLIANALFVILIAAILRGKRKSVGSAL